MDSFGLSYNFLSCKLKNLCICELIRKDKKDLILVYVLQVDVLLCVIDHCLHKFMLYMFITFSLVLHLLMFIKSLNFPIVSLHFDIYYIFWFLYVDSVMFWIHEQ